MRMVQSPRKVPRKDSIAGLRLCSGIIAEGDFAFDSTTKSRAEDNPDADESSDADEGEADVGAGEGRPSVRHVL